MGNGRCQYSKCLSFRRCPCSSISNIAPIEALLNLESFSLDNCEEIDSLTPLLSCKKLRYLSLIENTIIVDGRIKQLAFLPKIGFVRFANRKNYDAVMSDFPRCK
jgi:hypothetical protein